MSVDDYIVEFDNLMLKGVLQEVEEHTRAQFLGGLKYEISNMVNLQPYFSIQDVMKLALKVENSLK